MTKGEYINVLHKISEGYIIEDRVIDGQEGSLFLAISPLARQIASEGGGEYLEITVLIKWLPMDYSDTVATNLDERGVKISRV